MDTNVSERERSQKIFSELVSRLGELYSTGQEIQEALKQNPDLLEVELDQFIRDLEEVHEESAYLLDDIEQEKARAKNTMHDNVNSLEIMQYIADHTNLTMKDIREKVKETIKMMDNMVNEEGALWIILDDLGLSPDHIRNSKKQGSEWKEDDFDDYLEDEYDDLSNYC